jgi:hypothetical protein
MDFVTQEVRGAVPISPRKLEHSLERWGLKMEGRKRGGGICFVSHTLNDAWAVGDYQNLER